MKAEVISVGTELLLGHTINSDAAFVARELAEAGIDLAHMQVVGDNAARLEEALRSALERCDIVVTTGGLGPTRDDLTKEIAAKVAGLPLEEHEESMAALREYFGSRPMSENQAKQALMPKNAIVFPNSVGTAPGCAIPCGDGKFIVVLPGPPAELAAMLESGAHPFLEKLSGHVIHSTIIRTFGIGEGAAAQLLDDLVNGANPTVATYAAGGEMFVKVTARAEDRKQAKAMCAPLVQTIAARLGDVVYGLDAPSLEFVVVDALKKAGKTVAVAESCTGGLLAKRITDIAGSSAVFRLGLVTYANEAKEAVLGVSRQTLAEFGAVSPQTAQEMAKNARRLNSSDIGIGITGIAGPDGASPQKPLGLVYMTLDAPDGSWTFVMRPQGRYLGREWTRNRAASHALDMIRRYLAGLPVLKK